jgi:hypothetical protein
VCVYKDAGRGSRTPETLTWNETGSASINTSIAMSKYIQSGLIDAVFHSGYDTRQLTVFLSLTINFAISDLSYADGYLSAWDFFLDMMSPIMGSVIYLNTIGNHEIDWAGTSTIPYLISNGNSGGECGVVSSKLIPMPSPANIDSVSLSKFLVYLI